MAVTRIAVLVVGCAVLPLPQGRINALAAADPEEPKRVAEAIE